MCICEREGDGERQIDIGECFLFNYSLTFDPLWEPVVSLTNHGLSLLFNDLSPK